MREVPAKVFVPIPPLFHTVPTVLDHRNPEIAVFGHFGPILAISSAPGSNLGAPCCTKLVQKLQHGPALTRSTFVPCCSNRFGPPEHEIAIFGHFWPIWAIMGAPGPYLGAPCCSKLVQKHWLGPPLTCSTFVPSCSHGFDHCSLQIAIYRHFGPIWTILGHFWATIQPKNC